MNIPNITTTTLVEQVVDVIEDITMTYFTGELTPEVTSATQPTKVNHVIHFNDKVPQLLRQCYYIKQYFEHNYDENGHDVMEKRFRGMVHVNVTDKDITFFEKRGLFTRNITKVYTYKDKSDMEELDQYFHIDERCVPDYINDNIMTLTGVKFAGGSVIKAILRSESYIDKYYDRIEKQPKFRPITRVFNAKTVSTIAGITGLIIALI